MGVCVITGGAGGMGIAIARMQGKEHDLLLVDVSQVKLDAALETLREDGIQAATAVCDISDRGCVQALAERAAAMGEISAVIHTAGLSPTMAPAPRIVQVNALGTYYIIEEFFKVMGEDSSMVTVASLATHMMARNAGESIHAVVDHPDDPDFEKRLNKLIDGMAASGSTPAAGIAYSVSKYFSWRYTRRNVMRFWSKGIRINCVTPGNIATPMGKAEEAGCARTAAHMAIKRYGTPEEIAAAVAFLTSAAAGDTTGADLPVDGGFCCCTSFPQVGA